MKHTITAVIILFLIVLHSPAESKIYLDINAPGGRRLPLAVQDLKDIGGTNRHPSLIDEFRRVLIKDLEFTGFFDLIEKVAYLEDPLTAGITAVETDFSSWRLIGAEVLIKGAIKADQERVRIDLRLFDTIKERTMLGRRYSGKGNKDNIRRIAHRFADEVIEDLTNVRGIFNTKILLESDITGSKEIYIADYDGHNIRQVTNNGSINLSPQWSPGGSHLLYTSYKDGEPYLYIRNIETGKEIKISGRPGINIGGRWSPDGSRVALTLFIDKNPELYIMDIETKKLKRLTKNYAIDTSPSWSPDGKSLAFVSDIAGNPHIYVVDSDGTNLRRLTYNGKYNASPAWSPDGDMIAFSGAENGSFHIYTMRPDGTEIRKITFEGSNETPSWSPDGRYIVFGSKRGGKEWSIYITRADGSGKRKVISGKGNYRAPSWSPYLK